MANPAYGANAFAKPGKGTALLARKAARRAVEAFEDGEKRKARKRDRGCRWPGCDCRKLQLRTEVAHLHDKGIGGDHGIRSTADQMIELCFLKHQGPESLHSGDLRIDPLSNRGTSGPCAFYQRDQETNRMRHVVSERAVGVSEARR